MLITVEARVTRSHGPGQHALPAEGIIEYQPAAPGIWEGALRAQDPVVSRITDGDAKSVNLAPGAWRVNVVPEFGPAWEPWLIELEEDGPTVLDLAGLAPVAVIDGEKWLKGERGVSVTGYRDLGDGRIVWVFSDGTETDPTDISQGPQGVGIAEISDPDGDSKVTVTYTDGTEQIVQAIQGAPGKEGDRGDDGHTPVIEWDGTALVIDGETGPDLKGEQGEGADVDWDTLDGKPDTFTPATHTHVVKDVDGLQDALDDATTGLATETYVDDAVTTIPEASAEAAGLMAAGDKEHLDRTPTRAEVVESTTRTLIETYSLHDNFDAIEPRYITRPDVRVNNVIQSIGRTTAGLYYIAQRVSTSNDLEISRCDAGGRVIDSSVLIDGGHGASVGMEEQSDGVYLWVWWDGKSDGTTNALKRWKYVGGRDVPVDDPGVETMPDFGSSKPGFRWAGVNINQRMDLIGINNRTADGDNIEMCRFSDYVAGTHTVLGTLPALPLSEHGAFQGLVVTEEYCYVLRGTGGLESAHADRAHMDQFDWGTGDKLVTKELTYLAYLGRDNMGKAEPDGMCAWYDTAGRLSLLFVMETNTGGGNLHNIYSLAPSDFQHDTGAGAAMQLMFSPLNWVDVTLENGFEYRGEDYKLQVAKDPHGMVYLRGHMSNTGLSDVTSDITFATLPREYWPETEVRWIGYVTTKVANPWGGWIRTGSGTIVLQRNADHPDSGPTSHFCVIAQPWQTRA